MSDDEKEVLIRRMAKYISDRDIDEDICKQMPTIEFEACKKCKNRNDRNFSNCSKCATFYENNCVYADCVDCIIEWFSKGKS